MKDKIILKKIRKKRQLLKCIMNITILAKIAQGYSVTDLALKYNYTMSNVNLDSAKKLRLRGVNKYYRYVGQVKSKLNWLYN